MNECSKYINELFIPDNMDMELIKVYDAKSMTGGYNEGMHSTNAKYKVYLHQDVFITNKNFIFDMIEVFKSDSSIGMIGMVGTPYLHKSGVMWYGVRLGNFYKLDKIRQSGEADKFIHFRKGICDVEAVDGLLMVTQYDLAWRDDIFDKWDFYDVSQGLEYRRKGYRVVVPGTETYWYIHDCGIINLERYDDERVKFLQEYSDLMSARQTDSFDETRQKTKEAINACWSVEADQKQELFDMIDKIRD